MSRESQRRDGAPVHRVRRWSRALTVRVCRRALLGGAIAFAFVGALTTPPYVVLVFAPAFGIVVGSVVALVNPAFPKARSARRAAVFSATGTALVVPCLAGIVQFGSAGGVAALVLMVLGCIVVGGWIVEQSELPDHGDASDLDVETLRQFVQVLPTAMLLREWRSASDHVQPGAALDRRAEAVLVRTVLLEELSHRDPVGVARWLSDGDEEAPEQHLRGDSDATT